MIEISQFSFVLLAVYSVCFGLVAGVVYDILRITRVILGAERESKSELDFERISLPLIKRSAYSSKRFRAWDIILNAYVAVGDLAFALMCGVLSVMIAYAYNSGRVRVIIFAGLAVGFLLYYNTIGRLVMRVSEMIAFFVRCIAVYFFEGVRFLISKIIKIKIKKKGAKNDKRKDGKSKKDVFREDQSGGGRNIGQYLDDRRTCEFCFENR